MVVEFDDELSTMAKVNELVNAIINIVDTKEIVMDKDNNPTDETKLVDVDIEALKGAIDTLTEHKKETAQLVKDNEKAKKEVEKKAASVDGEKYAKSLNEGDLVIYKKSTDKKFGYVVGTSLGVKEGGKTIRVQLFESDTDTDKRSVKFASVVAMDFDTWFTEVIGNNSKLLDNCPDYVLQIATEHNLIETEETEEVAND